MAVDKKSLKRAANIALARKNFYHFCRLICPKVYDDEHMHLEKWTSEEQYWFLESDKKFFVLNAPPQHGKSLTAQLFAAWCLGRNPRERIMVLCYSTKLSKKFSKAVRSFISASHMSPNEDTILFCDIFPDVKIKEGEAAAEYWSVSGADLPSFWSCSIDSSKTGIGATILMIDDCVDGFREAKNEDLLRDRWEEINETVIKSRIVGGGRCLCASTRWATYDISGLLMETYEGDCYIHIAKALQDDGTMLCPKFLKYEDYQKRLKSGNKDIFLANFQQELISQEGKLYREGFKIWTPEMLPEKDSRGRTFVYKTECIIDVADKGSDFLCAIFYYPLRDGRIFIKDILYTDKPLRETQSLISQRLNKNDTNLCIGEGNAGGSIFIESLRKEHSQIFGNTCVFRYFNQTQNKESRILNQAIWCQEFIYMPAGWEKNYIDFNIALMRFQKIFKDNKHDDAADAITMIADRYNIVNNKTPKIYR